MTFKTFSYRMSSMFEEQIFKKLEESGFEYHDKARTWKKGSIRLTYEVVGNITLAFTKNLTVEEIAFMVGFVEGRRAEALEISSFLKRYV